ncbi:MBL fold metallo-hydrolase [Candidatus Micrarchaeota archaeon]|nr:MBL fold metallo-hydrolase [Candidatus Micrarchaeota archaeon]
MDIKWLGHSSLLVELGGRTLLFDPWLTPKDKHGDRLIAPALLQQDLRKCDLLFVTHEHFDHCDNYDAAMINSRTSCQVIAPQESLALLPGVNARSKVPVSQGDSFTLLGLDIQVTPAIHPQSINPVGYIVSSEREGKSIYFAGDTYDYHEMNSIDVDVAVLPIGGTFTMDVIAAISAARRIRAKYVIPIHYDTFAKIKTDVKDFEKRMNALNKAKPIILGVGEQVSI